MGSLIARKKMVMMQSGIQPPQGYRWLTYATSDGTAYVDLPFGFDSTDEIEMYSAIGTSGSDKFICAPNRWNDNSNRFGICGGFGTVFGVAFGNKGTNATKMTPDTPKDYNFHTWAYKNGVFRVVDLSISFDTTTVQNIIFGQKTKNLRLFYGYNAATAGKIAYYKHKQGDDEYYIRPMVNITTGDVEMYEVNSKTIMTRTGALAAPSN